MYNIPVDKIFELEQEYLEQPHECDLCGKDLTEDDDFELMHHDECYDKLIEEIRLRHPDNL